MKRLTLVRHAKSSWDSPGIPDHERPLAARGLHDAPRILERLAAATDAPALILSSDANRARATAEIALRAFGEAATVLRSTVDLYMADVADVVDLVCKLDDRYEHVMLVGHNPTFTELAVRLIPTMRLDNLPTCGVVAAQFGCKRWRDIRSTNGELTYLDFPKNTRSPVVSRP